MVHFRFFPIVVLIGLAASSCTSDSTNAVPAAETIEVDTSPRNRSESETRYINPEGGFSLVLPPGWEVAGPTPISQDGFTYNSYALGVDPTASGGPGTSRIIVADGTKHSVEEFIQLQCSTCPEHALEPIQIGGFPAVRTQIGGGGVPILVEWIFIERDGQLLGFSLHDPQTLEPLDNVMQFLVFD